MLGKLLLVACMIICHSLQMSSASFEDSINKSYEKGYAAERWNSLPALSIDQLEPCEQDCLSRCSDGLSNRQNVWGCYFLCCAGPEVLIQSPSEPEEQKENQCNADCEEFCINNIYIEDCRVKCLDKLCKQQSLSVDISDEEEVKVDLWSMLAYITIMILYATSIIGAILYLHRIRYILNICTDIPTDSELAERLISV